MNRRAATDVLIVKFEALGDVLRTTALLEPLRAAGRRVTFLTSPEALPLVERQPSLAAAHALRLDDPAAVARLGRRLAGRFDLVLSLEENPASAAVAAAACRGELVGVRVRDGRLDYTPSSARYYDMSLLHRGPGGGHTRADALKKGNRATYAELWLGILGLKRPRRLGPVLRLDARDRAAARRLARLPALRGRGRLLGLNAGAGSRWPAKQLSVDASARLLVELRRAFDCSFLLLGGKEAAERERNRLIAARVKRLDPTLPLVTPPRLPLRSFAGVVGLCDALVTTDSLAVHIAAALDVPAVCLVGPTCAQELDFAGAGAALKPPAGCSCFYAPRCSRESHCLDDIPAGAVAAAVRRCLR